MILVTIRNRRGSTYRLHCEEVRETCIKQAENAKCGTSKARYEITFE